MTKSLTEKWKDGSFKFGVYYCQTKDDGILKLELCHEGDGHGYAYCYGEEECYRYEDIEEVLAPVPSYDEYCNLVFQANKPKNPLSDVMMCYDTEREKKVVERLQEQLNEANDCINSAQISLRGYMLKINEYKKKWGVK